MTLLCTLILLKLASLGLHGQKIELEVPLTSQHCTNGFRDILDEIIINGTFGPNFSPVADSGWLTVSFKVLPVGAKEFILICDIAFEKHLHFCYKRPNKCRCDKFNATTGFAHFVFTFAANLNHSKGIVRAEVKRRDGKIVYSDNNQLLPRIYDVRKVNLTLYVNDIQASSPSGSCGITFKSGGSYNLKLCCSKIAMPCFPRIGFNGVNVAENQSPCVNYTFTAENEIVTLVKTYSVCKKNEDFPGSSCLIETSSENEHKGLGLILSLVVGLGVLVIGPK